ncbi:hypothetical protein [Nocardia sp. NPDC050717]|uniref:hypothetical protein n=1 Tax=Nocardia sp. NPDC050717 TaxID=3157221 RepID=UPI0033E73229
MPVDVGLAVFVVSPWPSESFASSLPEGRVFVGAGLASAVTSRAAGSSASTSCMEGVLVDADATARPFGSFASDPLGRGDTAVAAAVLGGVDAPFSEAFSAAAGAPAVSVVAGSVCFVAVGRVRAWRSTA